MAYCFKCGTELVEGARFCHNCAALVQTEEIEASVEEEIKTDIIVPEPPANASTYVISEPVQLPETTEEDRQSLLDGMRRKLAGEIVTWRVVSILNFVLVVVMLIGMIAGLAYVATVDTWEDGAGYEESYVSTEVSYDLAEETYDSSETGIWVLFYFFYFGFIISLYLGIPSAIVGLVISKKAARCKRKLYEDCTLALRRYGSASVIVIPAIFNPLVLIFTIPLFAVVRNNSRMLLEIADIQKNYYGY